MLTLAHMMLRTWGLLFFLGIFVFIVAGAYAAADAGFTHSASVWNQLQNTSGGRLVGHIDSLEVIGNNFKIHFIGTSSGAMEHLQTHVLEFCEETNRDLFPNQHAIQLAKQAWSTKATVELQLRGPWNTCIQSVRATKVPKSVTEKA
jgi:hypothetical protein